MFQQLRERLLLRACKSASVRFRHYAGTADRRLREDEFRKLGLDRAKDIPTWTTAAELEALYRLASSCPENPHIVEIGSYLGASTCYLAAGAAWKKPSIICIDTWGNETMPDGLRDTLSEFQRNTAGVSQMITVVRKPSTELSVTDIRPPIHLAFIDADHSYEATKADVAFVLPHMSPDGLLVFHDSATFSGVSKAIAEVLAGGEWCIGGHVENLTWLRKATWTPWPPPAGNEQGRIK